MEGGRLEVYDYANPSVKAGRRQDRAREQSIASQPAGISFNGMM